MLIIRKTAALVMCCLLLFAVNPATAVEMDLSAMTDDEILSLLEMLPAEVAARGLEKTATLPKGTYTAGKELPAGTYVFTCMAKGDEWGNVTVYSENGKGKQLLWEVVSAPEEGEEPEQIFMTLQEGDQLKSGVAFSLTITPGVVFK